MTMNWTRVMIAKITAPTTRLSPTTKSPNALMTWPASASSRIRRLVLTDSASRINVVNSSTEGKVEKLRMRST